MSAWAQALKPGEARRDVSLDGWLIGGALAIALLGVLFVGEAAAPLAEAKGRSVYRYPGMQWLALTVGTVAGGAILSLPYAALDRLTRPLYGVCLALLALVWAMGVEANGAKRWLVIGGVAPQPSELAKVAVILALAQFLSANRGRMRDVVAVGGTGLVIALLPIGLVALQRDLGTTVLLVSLAAVLFFVAGLPLKWFAGGGVMASAFVAYAALTSDFRWQRLTTFWEPFQHYETWGHQVAQGWMSMAAGGWTGVGLGAGTGQHGFVPEVQTDFIATVIAEEWGAAGWLLMVGLLGLLVGRAFTIAGRAPDLFGSLVAIGIGSMWAIQAIINLGMVVGLLPPKGIVLPFLSYGSTAALVYAACVGILLKIDLEGARRRSNGRGS